MDANNNVTGSENEGIPDVNKETMKAIVVTDPAAGLAGMKLSSRPLPKPGINDVIVRVHASGFVPTELEWPSTWVNRTGQNRTPSIPGHELAGVVSALLFYALFKNIL